MARVLALVEGPTERDFCRTTIAPHLGSLDIEFHPRVIGKPGHKGGNSWDRAKKEITGLIRQEPKSIFTTMFDLYALPRSWPGRADAIENGLENRAAVEYIEQRIRDEVLKDFPRLASEPRFVPYLSLHEFEALLFSSPADLGSVTGGRDHADQFQKILDECGGCEMIDDGPATAPSKRIRSVYPRYSKTIDGILAAELIGLPTIRQKCPHFDRWLGMLENSGALQR